MCTLVHNKIKSHRFPQETFERGSPAPAMESQTLPPTLGSHHSTYGFLKSPTCRTSNNCPATCSSRGQREASKEDDPHRLRNPSKEAVIQTLEKQWSGSGYDRRVAKGKGKVSPSGSKAGNGLRDHILLLRGLCCKRERHRLMKTPLVVKAANFSAAHQFLCGGRLVTDTHAHQHTSPPPGPVTPYGST